MYTLFSNIFRRNGVLRYVAQHSDVEANIIKYVSGYFIRSVYISPVSYPDLNGQSISFR